jgi:hypothetical protein
MKIRSLHLQNYRNHLDTAIDLSDTSFCIIRGANASGKTSIAQALSLNLASTTMGLASDGKGYQSKIRYGEKQATITAEIQGQHILENVVTLSVGTAGRAQVVKCLDAPDDKKITNGFENFLARYNDALRIALNTDYFARMGEKDQKNLLAKLVLPSRYDFPQDKQFAVHGAIGANLVNFEEEPFSVIEKSYKLLYKERENINRDVKNFIIPDALPIPRGVNSESLQTELTGIRAEREKLQKDRDAAVAKVHKEEVERATLQTKIEGLRAKLEEGKSKLATIETSILSEDDFKKLKAIEAQAEELAKLKMEHNTWLSGMRVVNEQIEKMRSLADKGTTCPTCEQDIDSAKIAGLIEGLKKEVADADVKLQALDKKIEGIGDCTDASAKIKKHEQAVKDKAELTKSLTETVAEGKKTRVALDALGEKQDATLSFNDPLGTLQVKEDKIVEQLRPVIAAEERAKDIKTKRERLEKLEAKAKTLQELVTYFDKDGIKATLIAEHIGGFESKLNSVLSAWGYEASLSTDLSSFNVSTPRGYVGPVKEMSGAEEHIFKVAFQCAVSSAAGIRLVVIDEVEELGEDIRQPLYRTIYELIEYGALDQAILIGYSLDKTVPEPKAPGSLYLYVENGEVEVLG